MRVWYEIIPIDTLFFRGTTPMEAGNMSARSLFPPPLSVIEGAIRTGVLIQHGVPYNDICQGIWPHELQKYTGQPGGEALFKITALLLKRADTYYAPCPAHWYREGDSPENGASGQILRAGRHGEDLQQLGAVTSNSGELPYIPGGLQPKPLTDDWVDLAAIATGQSDQYAEAVIDCSELYSRERRTGIGIDRQRRVIKGRLYSSEHIRLHNACRLAIGFDREVGLDEEGVLQLGGERRMVRYERVAGPPLPTGSASLNMSLVPLELTARNLPLIFSAGPPTSVSGWDLHTKFHKPTRQILPAGAVFVENINDICIPIEQ